MIRPRALLPSSRLRNKILAEPRGPFQVTIPSSHVSVHDPDVYGMYFPAFLCGFKACLCMSKSYSVIVLVLCEQKYSFVGFVYDFLYVICIYVHICVFLLSVSCL